MDLNGCKLAASAQEISIPRMFTSMHVWYRCMHVAAMLTCRNNRRVHDWSIFRLQAECPGNNTVCVDAISLCNNVPDCPDASDEDPQFCKSFTCPDGKVRH